MFCEWLGHRSLWKVWAIGHFAPLEANSSKIILKIFFCNKSVSINQSNESSNGINSKCWSDFITQRTLQLACSIFNKLVLIPGPSNQTKHRSVPSQEAQGPTFWLVSHNKYGFIRFLANSFLKMQIASFSNSLNHDALLKLLTFDRLELLQGCQIHEPSNEQSWSLDYRCWICKMIIQYQIIVMWNHPTWLENFKKSK